MVTHAFKSRAWWAEAGESLSSRSACLQSEIQDNWGYRWKLCLKQASKQENKQSARSQANK